METIQTNFHDIAAEIPRCPFCSERNHTDVETESVFICESCWTHFIYCKGCSNLKDNN
jgi:hypothetical protein